MTDMEIADKPAYVKISEVIIKELDASPGADREWEAHKIVDQIDYSRAILRLSLAEVFLVREAIYSYIKKASVPKTRIDND